MVHWVLHCPTNNFLASSELKKNCAIASKILWLQRYFVLGRSSSGGTTPQRSPHHSASRHDTPGGGSPPSSSSTTETGDDLDEGKLYALLCGFY